MVQGISQQNMAKHMIRLRTSINWILKISHWTGDNWKTFRNRLTTGVCLASCKKNRSRTCARSHIAKPIFLGDNHGLEKKTPIFVGRWGQLKGSQPQINHHPLKIRKFFNREKSSRNCQLSCHFPVRKNFRKNFHSWSPEFPPMLRCCRVEVDPFPWDLQVSWLLLMIRGYITW